MQKNERIDETKLKGIKLGYTLYYPAGCAAAVDATGELPQRSEHVGSRRRLPARRRFEGSAAPAKATLAARGVAEGDDAALRTIAGRCGDRRKAPPWRVLVLIEALRRGVPDIDLGAGR